MEFVLVIIVSSFSSVCVAVPGKEGNSCGWLGQPINWNKVWIPTVGALPDVFGSNSGLTLKQHPIVILERETEM